MGDFLSRRGEKNRPIMMDCEHNESMNLTVKGNKIHNYKRDRIFCEGLYRLEMQSVFKSSGGKK